VYTAVYVAIGSSIGSRRSRHFPDALPSSFLFFFPSPSPFVYKAIITSVILNSGTPARHWRDLYGRRAPIHDIIKSHIHTAESIRRVRARPRAARTCSSSRQSAEERVRSSWQNRRRSRRKSRMTMLLRRRIVVRLFASSADSPDRQTRHATSVWLADARLRS